MIFTRFSFPSLLWLAGRVQNPELTYLYTTYECSEAIADSYSAYWSVCTRSVHRNYRLTTELNSDNITSSDFMNGHINSIIDRHFWVIDDMT